MSKALLPTMAALVLDQYATAMKLTQVARPLPGPGQVLVRIIASGVNPLDTKIRLGQATHAQHPVPAILGIDLAGVVAEAGPGVTGFVPGDEVYGMAGGVGGNQGSLAEFAAVDADLIAHKPANLTMLEAAALPLIVITAWEGLVDRAHVRAGQTVLIHGGAGGIGHVAIQLALSYGARVFATGKAEQKTLIEDLGAIAIDYTTLSVEDYMAVHTAGEGFDIVFDTVGGTTLDDSFKATRIYEGHVLSALGWGSHNLAPLSFRGATYSGVFTLLPLLTGKGRAHHGAILRAAARLAEVNQLTPRLDPRQWTLETAHLAHEAIETGTAQGKLVVSIAK